MTRLAAILLSAFLLLQSLPMGPGDLAQLDELLEHARYHKEQFGDSFLTFLNKHYGDLKEAHERNHQEERQQHEQLPFQQLSLHAFPQTCFLPGERFEWNTPEQTPDKESPLAHSPLRLSSIFIGGVFQPPRSA
ncbi:hypothetical protein [Robiginitalea marina]|uniref:Uncharacterized protein n=1 Tax=Robiginitalea marina TaxID=2954105 RepID=A0ABT1AZV7_9FLAO|nr:hypothetical protein [Robiginitalea marina]MCO5725583.1 hypothetical protein [Robiginitalea marina]